MKDLYDITLPELEELCSRWSKVHAKALFRSMYKDYNRAPWDEASLPREFAHILRTEYQTNPAKLFRESVSRYDGTAKFLVQLADGSLIESVLMPEKGRITLCVSSQVGCAMACSFCHTGRMGLTRHLTAGEIVAQVMLAREWVRAHPEWREERGYGPRQTVCNIVFMGMGEPLDNVEAVIRALEILCEPVGPGFGPRKISVSTAGHLDGLKILMERMPKVSLALSLHATTNLERSRLMPINRRWPIADVVAYLREIFAARGDDKSVLIQYTVINGVNDTEEKAQGIVDLLRGLPVKINIIPLNTVGPSRFQGPDPESLERFRDYLHRAGMRVMVRYSKGQDIEAACGQLVVSERQKTQPPMEAAVSV